MNDVEDRRISPAELFPDFPGKLPGHCGDLHISIDRQGRWFYHGSPINRKEMVCLFASVMHRGSDGGYYLITPGELGRIKVEDVPFMAVEMAMTGSGAERVISFRTNVDEIVTLDADHPLRIAEDTETGEPSPYVLVRKGLEARLTRSVYYELVSQGWEEQQGHEVVYGLWSSGTFFPLGSLDALG